MSYKLILALLAWALLPPALLLLLHGNFLLSSILYFILPAAYFSYRMPRMVPRATVIATLSIPFIAMLDYIAFLNNAWTVPSVSTFRILTFIPIEDFVFTVAGVYLIVMAWAYFFHPPQYERINITRVKVVALGEAILFALFLLVYAFAPTVFRVPYYYFFLVLFFFVLPALILLKYFPAYHKSLLRAVPHSFVLMLLWELVALALGFWTFPGEYLAFIRLGGLHFPVEEMVSWMILFLPATLAFTEIASGTDARSAP